MMPTPKIIRQLIVINVIFFLLSVVSPRFFELMSMHFPLNPRFHWWQVITHMFMHGGLLHITFNMYGLWAFGSPIVHHYGEKRFLWFYLLSGLGGLALFTGIQYYQFQEAFEALRSMGVPAQGIWETLLHPQNNVIFGRIPKEATPFFNQLFQIYNLRILGASAAVYGVLVAFAFFYPRAKLIFLFLPYPLEAKYFVPLLILSDIVFGFTNYLHLPIAHFAHVGGALTGLLLLWLWRKHHREYYF